MSYYPKQSERAILVLHGQKGIIKIGQATPTEATPMETQHQLHPETPPFEFKTDLARQLWQLRQQSIAAGSKLLDWEGLDCEMASLRGQLSWPVPTRKGGGRAGT